MGIFRPANEQESGLFGEQIILQPDSAGSFTPSFAIFTQF
jgi:hypothetical protein